MYNLANLNENPFGFKQFPHNFLVNLSVGFKKILEFNLRGRAD